MALAAPDSLKGLRDRALLLLGFAGAFRRSELVALDVADLEETDDGFKVTIRRSKTDQERHGETIAIVRGSAACLVKAVKAWLAAAGISEGPLLRPVAKGGRLGAQRLTERGIDVDGRSDLCAARWRVSDDAAVGSRRFHVACGAVHGAQRNTHRLRDRGPGHSALAQQYHLNALPLSQRHQITANFPIQSALEAV